MKTAKRNIILASASPRRKELLQRLGLEFDIVPASIDEKQNDHEDAATYTLRTAMQKALAVAKNYTDATVISADTVVVMDEQILGKPKTMDQAEEMLRNLSGREHVVITSVGIVDQISGRSISATEQTLVYFQTLSKEEIRAYVETCEPMDKAGAYGIQGLGGLFIRRIEGDFYNVVGLPLNKLYQLLKEIEIRVL